jgi:hypothetical protein
MTNDDGHKPEGAPERSPKAGEGAPFGRRWERPEAFFRSAQTSMKQNKKHSGNIVLPRFHRGFVAF